MKVKLRSTSTTRGINVTDVSWSNSSFLFLILGLKTENHFKMNSSLFKKQLNAIKDSGATINGKNNTKLSQLVSNGLHIEIFSKGDKLRPETNHGLGFHRRLSSGASLSKERETTSAR